MEQGTGRYATQGACFAHHFFPFSQVIRGWKRVGGGAGSPSLKASGKGADEGLPFQIVLLILQKSGKLSLLTQFPGLLMGRLQGIVLDDFFGALLVFWKILPDGGDVVRVGFYLG